MPTLDKKTAARWLKEGPPVLFFATADEYAAANSHTQAAWRFTKGKAWLKRIAEEGRVQAVKDLLIEDFATAPAQVKAVAREAWIGADETQVIARVIAMLDALRDNFASFNAASKAWILKWAKMRGVRRAGEED